MTPRILRAFLLGVFAFCALSAAPACRSTSYKSVRVYEYNDEPQPQEQKRSENDELDSEWKMQSEGEMVAPGR